jgi:hypothetical protein
MNPLSLVPIPDMIPAPAWVFLGLDILLFAFHILLINVALGSMLLIVFSRGRRREEPSENPVRALAASKIPTFFALGINFGVAPLLFLQVIYGHLFYSSSILMAVYWILIIPFLILAYYGAYLHAGKFGSQSFLGKAALWMAAVILLCIGFVFVNNMTLMLQPEKWVAYFENPRGTILNLSEPTLVPRYLHFVTASVAVGGLFMAFLWKRKMKINLMEAEEKGNPGLKIFGFATAVQILIGLWFLMAIPRDFLLEFLGGDVFSTIVFLVGFAGAIGAVAAAFANRLGATGVMFGLTIGAMVITRHNLRAMYLKETFNLNNLQISPQYGIMALFFVVLIIGAVSVWYMIRLSRSTENGRTS